jgi:hypothetical protein
VIETFWEKNVKVVEFPQFESLGGGVKCHIWNFWGKCANEWIIQEVKCSFPKIESKSSRKEGWLLNSWIVQVGWVSRPKKYKERKEKWEMEKKNSSLTSQLLSKKIILYESTRSSTS